MKKRTSKEEFMALLKDGMRIMVGGFLTCGTPEKLIDWLVESNIKDLTIICNDAGYPERGVGKLLLNNQVKKLIVTHIGTNPNAGKLMSEGQVEVELIPQGTFVEQIRAYAGRLGGVLSPTGIHTPVEEGKEIIEIKGQKYILSEPIGADLAIINAYKADAYGNLIYQGSSRNFNPTMAMAADKVVVLVKERILDLDPEVIITPHPFVDYIVEV
ncbi:MAG: CoA transferase subunit A [Acholeplasma sp.]|jgi:acetate CoA/acetoacetate CoA-transferase alpha subunit|nr:MAG: CoA transferase subunit A [Acholeplasma sp.]